MNNLIKLIVFTIFIAFVLPHYAAAQENKEMLNQPTDSINQTNEITEAVENIEPSSIEDIQITGKESPESINVNVDLNTDEEQINTEMTINTDENANNIVELNLTDENGHIINNKYHLEIYELNKQVVKAKLVDYNTLEVITIDSTQLQSTAIPVIIALIVRAGLQYVIKHYGKKLAMQAMIDFGVSQITKAYGGSVKNASNGKGKVITIPNKKQTIVIRLMEAGSGGRKDAYWRMSVGNKSINRAGNYSNNAAETHIILQESSIGTIINLIKKFKK